MLARIAETIERHRMFETGQSVAVAVSGGVDSVCLLHALLELSPRWGLRLGVVHLDHGLRGAESRADAQFVRELADRLRVPVLIRAVDLLGSAGNLEQAARKARLAFFREQILTGAAQRVALGHTQNDQAETVLFRFLRGSGTAGLAAIRPVTGDGIVRPLIAVQRCEVEEYLRRRGIAWREDSTNASLEFARNRIRHHLLPQLAREWNPAIVGTLAHTADWALAEEDFWDGEMRRLGEQFLVEQEGAVLLRAQDLSALPLASRRRLVRRAIERAKGDLRGVDFDHIGAILDLGARHRGYGRVQAPGLKVQRSFDWLRFRRPHANPSNSRGYRMAAPVPGVVRLPSAGVSISLELIEKKETSDPANSVYNDVRGYLDWRALSGCLEVRNWKPGDQYQPRGGSGEEKLKTLFQQARIPEWERRNWPVLLDGVSIVWARQFGPAERFAARPDSSVILIVREQSESGLGTAASIGLKAVTEVS